MPLAITAAYNEGTSLFAGLGYDSAHILFAGLQAGVDDKAKIRDGIEGITNLPISQGVVNYLPTITSSMVATTNGWSSLASLQLRQGSELTQVPLHCCGCLALPGTRAPFENKGGRWRTQILQKYIRDPRMTMEIPHPEVTQALGWR